MHTWHPSVCMRVCVCVCVCVCVHDRQDLYLNSTLFQIHKSTTLGSQLTTYIPQAVNNGRFLFIISGFFSEIISGCFFIISNRKHLECSESSIWRRKKNEVTKTSEQSGVEPDRDHSLKNLQSIDLGYLRVDKCRRNSKEIDETISVTVTNCLYLPALRWQAFATRRDEAFVSCFSSRESVVSELIFLEQDR